MSARVPGSWMERAICPISWGSPGDNSTIRTNWLTTLAMSASVSLSFSPRSGSALTCASRNALPSTKDRMRKRLRPCNRSWVRLSWVLAILRISAPVPTEDSVSFTRSGFGSPPWVDATSPSSRSLAMTSSTNLTDSS
jgi:hypothetical protein